MDVYLFYGIVQFGLSCWEIQENEEPEYLNNTNSLLFIFTL
jgi:hypothetical protein